MSLWRAQEQTAKRREGDGGLGAGSCRPRARVVPGHSPFSTLSSVGMSLNSLWYCELYLLAA